MCSHASWRHSEVDSSVLLAAHHLTVCAHVLPLRRQEASSAGLQPGYKHIHAIAGWCREERCVFVTLQDGSAPTKLEGGRKLEFDEEVYDINPGDVKCTLRHPRQSKSQFCAASRSAGITYLSSTFRLLRRQWSLLADVSGFQLVVDPSY